MSSRSTGASGAIALNGSMTTGSASYSTSTSSIAVSRGIAVVGDHEGDFLILEQHFLFGQHRLHVAGEGRHPVQLERLQVAAVSTASTPGTFIACRVSIDLIRAWACGDAHKIAVQHARQLQVVDVIALALSEAGVLDAFALAAHALRLGGALFPRGSQVVHSAASLNSRH